MGTIASAMNGTTRNRLQLCFTISPVLLAEIAFFVFLEYDMRAQQPSSVTVTEKLKSNLFSEYADAIEEIRNSSNAGGLTSVDEETFQLICRSFWLYRFQYEDIRKLKLRIHELLGKHSALLGTESINGLSRYVWSYLKGEYNGSGFPQLTSSFEASAQTDAENIGKILSKDFPDDSKVFLDYAVLMKSINKTCESARAILEKLGNRHLSYLKGLIHELDPYFQSCVLRALEGFSGNKNVVSFYNDYIERFEAVRQKSRGNKTIEQYCDSRVSEARQCLSHVGG